MHSLGIAKLGRSHSADPAAIPANTGTAQPNASGCGPCVPSSPPPRFRCNSCAREEGRCERPVAGGRVNSRAQTATNASLFPSIPPPRSAAGQRVRFWGDVRDRCRLIFGLVSSLAYGRSMADSCFETSCSAWLRKCLRDRVSSRRSDVSAAPKTARSRAENQNESGPEPLEPGTLNDATCRVVSCYGDSERTVTPRFRSGVSNEVLAAILERRVLPQQVPTQSRRHRTGSRSS